MAVCEVCGNTYARALLISVEGRSGQRAYDSFECAIAGMAPHCAHCETPVIGHGIQDGETVYCCAHCAHADGAAAARDNVRKETPA